MRSTYHHIGTVATPCTIVRLPSRYLPAYSSIRLPILLGAGSPPPPRLLIIFTLCKHTGPLKARARQYPCCRGCRTTEGGQQQEQQPRQGTPSCGISGRKQQRQQQQQKAP